MKCVKCGTEKHQRLTHLWYVDWRGMPAASGLWTCKNTHKCRTRQHEARPAKMTVSKHRTGPKLPDYCNLPDCYCDGMTSHP